MKEKGEERKEKNREKKSEKRKLKMNGGTPRPRRSDMAVRNKESGRELVKLKKGTGILF